MICVEFIKEKTESAMCDCVPIMEHKRKCIYL